MSFQSLRRRMSNLFIVIAIKQVGMSCRLYVVPCTHSPHTDADTQNRSIYLPSSSFSLECTAAPLWCCPFPNLPLPLILLLLRLRPCPVSNPIQSFRFFFIHLLYYYLILFTLLTPTQSNILARSSLIFSLHSAPQNF